ncbi:endonuclease/exonuclease/phosphatase family protein [Olivibacter sitiensis]|uniref:endonuclease/exonuclease/phosphatase family protein n=1 Tax=Olivibacter sitiensis TaxID=376470 RepID=UPI000427DBC3|nr:endonuclease/exonuclease/phosphatase family protein [Olivibacter sitiensis]
MAKAAKRRNKKGRMGFMSKLLLVVNIFTVIALFLSFLAPYVNPRSFWPLAFFGIAYPFLLAFNVCFIAFWAMRRSWFFLLSLVVVIGGYGSFRKNMGFGKAIPQEALSAPDSLQIRVMTFNVHSFRHYEKNSLVDAKDEMLALIRGASPDIVCIQEFYTRHKGKYNIRGSITKELGMAHSYFFPLIKNDYESYGLMVLSKYPIKKAGVLDSFKEAHKMNKVIYADVHVGRRTFRVYNVHLQSIGFQTEDYDFIKKTAAHPLDGDIAGTKRIGYRLKQAYVQRSLQADHLRAELDKCKMAYMVVGDFNDTPLSYAVHKVGENMNNVFREKGRGWAVTYNGDFPNFQIDYLFCSPEFSIERYHIIKKKVSDHYPLWCDVSLQ